jgi:hypothetical protein
MGVTFTHLLLPMPRSRTPSYAELARAVGRLVDEGFLLPPGSSRLPHMRFDEGSILYRHAASSGCFIQYGWEEAGPFPSPPTAEDLAAVADRSYKLVWPVVSFEVSGLRYPSTLLPEGIDPVDVYYDVEIHWGRQYVYRTSELIEPFESESCSACGAALSVPDAEVPDDAELGIQLYRFCPACGAEFRPEDRTALVYDPRDRTPGRPVLGGATSRFALAIECGKCWEYGAAPTEGFQAACEEALGCRLEHVLDGTF